MESLQALPDEVIFSHIFPWLPAKSLVRFRCVCKSWSSLTRSPLFITTHRKNFRSSNEQPDLLLSAFDSVARRLHFLYVQPNLDTNSAYATHLLTVPTLPSCEMEYPLHIKALTCKGLIFIYSSRNKFGFPAYIYNPCTKESLVLPRSRPIRRRVHVSHHFGYSPSSDEYKVLRVQKTVSRFKFQVFTLGTSSWRRIEVDSENLPFDLIENQFDIGGVCTHGAIHWMHACRFERVLIVFDMAEEAFKTIPLPHGFSEYGVDEWNSNSNYTGDVVEMGGWLALFCSNDMLFWQLKKIELWVLKDYDDQIWLKRRSHIHLLGAFQVTQVLYVLLAHMRLKSIDVLNLSSLDR